MLYILSICALYLYIYYEETVPHKGGRSVPLQQQTNYSSLLMTILLRSLSETMNIVKLL